MNKEKKGNEGINKMRNKIKPEDWIVDLICPKCKRAHKPNKTVYSDGLYKYRKIGLPEHCHWCDMIEEENEKEN